MGVDDGEVLTCARMPRTGWHYSAWALGMLAALAVSVGEASASPLDDLGIGGTVFTGPAHPHPSAVFINPAALDIARPGSHFFLGGFIGLDSINIDRSTITDPNAGVQPGPKVSSFLAHPGGMFAFHQKLEQLSIGLSVALPMVERFPKSDDLRYHARSGRFVQIAPASLAVALRPFDRVHIGVGLSLVLSELRMTFARDTALDGGTAGINETTCGGSTCGIENPAASQTIAIDVGTQGLKPFSVFNVFDFIALRNATINMGTVVRVRDGWFAGLSYRTAPNFFSEQTLPGTVTVTDASRDGGTVREGKAEVSFRANQSILFGLRGGPLFERFDMVLGIQFHDLSRHNKLDIRIFGDELVGSGVPEQLPRFRGFTDVWRVEAGLESRSVDSFRYGARLRFETAGVEEERVTPIQVHGTNLGIALGAELRFGGGWSFGGSYVVSWFPTMNAGNSAFDPVERLSCVDSEFEINSCEAVREGRAIPTAAGNYKRLLQGFTAWLRYDTL